MFYFENRAPESLLGSKIEAEFRTFDSVKFRRGMSEMNNFTSAFDTRRVV